MKTYDAGESFALKMDITQVDVPTSATYRVVDHAGVVLVPDTPIEVYGDDEHLEIVISSDLTQVAAGERRKLLRVMLTVVGQDDELFKFSESVLIQALNKLLIPAESFQTVDEASMIAMDVFNLPNWEVANRELRRKALIESAHRIKRISFNLTDSHVGQDYIEHPNWLLTDDSGAYAGFDAMTEVDFNALPTLFLHDLKIAQVVEADAVLGLETPESKRASGVLSDTVGETSQMFRSGRPIDLPVSKRTLRYLSRWMLNRWSIGRG